MLTIGDEVRIRGHVCEIPDHGGWRLTHGAEEMRDGRRGQGQKGVDDSD